MEKYRESDIKPFKFDDLRGASSTGPSDFKPFSFGELSGTPVSRASVTEDTIRSERVFEKKNEFKIDNIVREYRGLSRQEQADLEKRINDEVNARLQEAYRQAFDQGLSEGREEGKTQALTEFQNTLADKLESVAGLVSELQAQGTQLDEKARRDLRIFIKRFTKWILLREINEQTYLADLLEKLLLELNERKNLIIKVGQANFSQMPEVIQAVEARLGQLSNVRVEIVPELAHPGIILESENGLIDGSLEGVFANIDRIFATVSAAGVEP